jgi:hypothetical protein
MTAPDDPDLLRCFCCGTSTELGVDDAVRIGWSASVGRRIAACPRHSIHTHDVNVSRLAHQCGLTVDQFYRLPLLIDGGASPS